MATLGKAITDVFTPAPIIEFPADVVREWESQGLVEWENNGIPWPGNAYLLTVEFELDIFRDQAEEIGIDWRRHAIFTDGYTTSSFGFGKPTDRDYEEMGEELDICEKAMTELGIGWCGWPDAPFFTVRATPEQITQLHAQLQEPIRTWRVENGYDTE